MLYHSIRIGPVVCHLSSLVFVASLRPDAFVQLFEWSWPDIEKECVEFLGPKGFAAVQISPLVEHAKLDGQWYERYQPASYKLITRSGNESQLASMIQTCKKAGVKIYADVVFNHMAAGCGVGYAGAHFCNRSYVMWQPEDFHHKPHTLAGNCGIDWAAWKHDKATGGDPPANIIWNCDLAGLPDLASEKPHVQETIAHHLRHVLDLGAEGLRIDAAKHMKPEHILEIFDRVKSTGPFPADVPLELFSKEKKPVKPSMYLDVGQIEYFGYSKLITNGIANASNLGLLVGIDEKFAYPSHDVVVFLDNHDTQRDGVAKMTYRNSSLYVMANVFMLAWPYGYPKVMSSFYIPDWLSTGIDQGPPQVPVHDGHRLNCQDGKTWVCEHRIPAIANMVAWRRVADKASPRYFVEQSGVHLAFGRGSAFLAMNRDTSTWHAKVQTGLPSGSYCDISVSSDPDSCPHVFVDEMSFATIAVPGVGTTAFHIGAKPSKASMMVSLSQRIMATGFIQIVTMGVFVCICAIALVRGFRSAHTSKVTDLGKSLLVVQ